MRCAKVIFALALIACVVGAAAPGFAQSDKKSHERKSRLRRAEQQQVRDTAKTAADSALTAFLVLARKDSLTSISPRRDTLQVDSLAIMGFPPVEGSPLGTDIAQLPQELLEFYELFGEDIGTFAIVTPMLEGFVSKVEELEDFPANGLLDGAAALTVVTPFVDVLASRKAEAAQMFLPSDVSTLVPQPWIPVPEVAYLPSAPIPDLQALAEAAAASKAAAPMFNARDYSLQKRYRPADITPYSKKDFWSSTYVSAGASVFVPMMKDYSYGPSAQISLGHVFGRHHDVRIGTEPGYYYDAYYGYRMNRVAVSLSYMFDLTTYVLGYDSGRICDFSLGAGADWMYKWSAAMPSQNAGHIGLHFSVEANLHIFRYLDVFAAPTFYAFQDPNSTLHSDNWKELMPAFGGAMGCKFYMGSGRWKDSTPGLQTYFFAGSGAKMQNSAQVRRLPSGRRGGYSVFFGAGRHYTDIFDMRAIVEYSHYNWAQSMNGTILPTHNASIGVDAIVDMAALCSQRDDIPVNVSLVAGPRIGIFKKCGATGVETLIKPYAGFYTGAQLKIFLPKRLRILVEPGVTFVPYTASSLDPHYAGVNRSYYDAVMGVNVGLEYALPLR